jgi:hypothetical protein
MENGEPALRMSRSDRESLRSLLHGSERGPHRIAKRNREGWTPTRIPARRLEKLRFRLGLK